MMVKRMRWTAPFLLLAAVLAFPGCGGKKDRTELAGDSANVATDQGYAMGDSAMSLMLQSSAFTPGGTIPTEHTCSGADTSPPLSWGEPPAGTQSFVLFVDDPDAPSKTWVHWVLYDIPASARSLPAGAGSDTSGMGGGAPVDTGAGGGMAGQGVPGRNDFGKLAYRGPCPPPGAPHHYSFRIYALDRRLELPPGRTLDEVRDAMSGHVRGQGELVGLFGRS
jgi:Raf kinase inhibitor-like YbhB/YbcL family protein